MSRNGDMRRAENEHMLRCTLILLKELASSSIIKSKDGIVWFEMIRDEFFMRLDVIDKRIPADQKMVDDGWRGYAARLPAFPRRKWIMSLISPDLHTHGYHLFSWKIGQRAAYRFNLGMDLKRHA